MPDTTRVALLDGPRQLRLLTRPKPEPGPGQALVHCRATALCHTDLEIYTGRHPNLRFPIVMGHESTGIIEAVGPGVTDLAPGDRVILNPIIECSHCDMCQLGRENCCRNAGILGREFEGSLAEHLALDRRYIFKMPNTIPLDAGTIVETLATVRHGQERVRISPGSSVAVLGTGAAGILHTQLARLSGGDPVIGISRSPWKLQLALERGATHVVNAKEEDPTAAVLRITEGQGADVVIECSGSPALMTLSLKLARPGGTVLVYSIGTQPVPDLTTFPLYIKELTIVGTRGLQARDYPPAIRLVASGAMNVDGLINRTYQLEDVAEAFSYFEGNPHEVTRVLVET